MRPTKRLRDRASRCGTPARRRRSPLIAYTPTGVEGVSGVRGLPRLAMHLVLYQSVCGSTDKDGIGRGLLLEPSRYIERVADRSPGQLRVVYQRADHHVPRVQSQAERYAVRYGAKRVRRVQTLTQLEGRQHRPAGMVLLCHRRSEQGQEALTGDLEEGTAVALHHVVGQHQDGTHQVVHGFRPQSHRQGRSLGQSPAQHSDLFVFPFFFFPPPLIPWPSPASGRREERRARAGGASSTGRCSRASTAATKR